MKALASSLLFSLLASIGVSSYAWDPLGDIRDPRRILRNVEREARTAGGNVEREVRNAGREIDRMRLEGQAQAGAPGLEQWLIQSRNTARRGGTSPIPAHIRQQLQGFYDEDILNRASYKIGDNGAVNLANLSIRCGNADAVTLIDVIVFRNASDAHNNAVLWAHELKHVQQFRDWGVRDFSIRYLRSWNSVEDAAYAAENSFAERRNRFASLPPPPRPHALPGQPPLLPLRVAVARICATPFGACPMGMPVSVGSQCWCSRPGAPPVVGSAM